MTSPPDDPEPGPAPGKPQAGPQTLFRAILHIGTPRTAAAQLQDFLMRQRHYLQDEGMAFCSGLHGAEDFKALFHAAVSPSRRALMHDKVSRLGGLLLTGRVQRRIDAFRRRHRHMAAIFSAEMLSLLRQRDEMMRLKRLFPPGTEFTIVMCLREPADFLEAWGRELDGRRIPRGKEPGLSTYVEANSWLADYDALISAYSLISSDIRVIDYGNDADGGRAIGPAFCRALGMNTGEATA